MMKVAAAMLCVLALPLSPTLVRGQGRPPLKRVLPVIAARPTCPAAGPAKSSTPEQRRAARDIAQRAQQSAILGDRNAARDQLRQAAALDPTTPDLAYQLARAQEGLGATEEATAEYCRFLALAPTAPEAAEVRERLAGLTRASQATVSERVLAPFRTGVAAYEAGRFAQAEIGFSTAIALQPDWAEAYYNRALTNAARGRRELAVADLQQYLRLRPEAEDRAAVIARISSLRGGPLSPSAALGLGLVIPGAGQLYTGRKLFGVATMAAAGGALAWALKHDPVTKEYLVNPVDPFGNPLPPFTETRSELGRPYLVPGLAGVGAIAISSAVEAFIYARRVNAREQRFSAVVTPTADGLALRLTLR
jgi:tetratricopeptide (TPR) repeat protein